MVPASVRRSDSGQAGGIAPEIPARLPRVARDIAKLHSDPECSADDLTAEKLLELAEKYEALAAERAAREGREKAD
jgi:hypothetical protein